MDEDGFEEFSPSRGHGPTITLTNKRLHLNTEAQRQLLDGPSRRVRVKLNPTTGVVVVAPTTEEDNGYKVNVTGSFAVAVATHMRELGFAPKRYPATITDGVLTFTMEKAR